MFQSERTLHQFLCVLWTCISRICFRKTPKDLHGPIKKDRDTNSNLFGRNVDYWQNEGRDYSSTRNRYSFTSVPEICYKSEKFSDVTSSGERISGKDCHFKGNYYFPSKEKITINKSVRVYIRIHRQVLELTKMLGHLTSSILAIVAAKLHCRFVQLRHWRKMVLTKVKCYWTKNFSRSFIIGWKTSRYTMEVPEFNFPPRSFKDRCFTHMLEGTVWEGIKTGVTWTQQERRMHIYELELLALKLALKPLLKAHEIESMHIQMSNIVALTNLQMVGLSEQIWELLLRKK